MSERIEIPPAPAATEGDQQRLSAAIDRLTSAVNRLEQSASSAQERNTAALLAAGDEAAVLRDTQSKVAGRLDAALLRLRRTLET